MLLSFNSSLDDSYEVPLATVDLVDDLAEYSDESEDDELSSESPQR